MFTVEDAIPDPLWRDRLFSEAPIPMAYAAADGRFIDCNARYCALLGYARSELLAKRWQQITHPEDLDGALKSSNRLLAEPLETSYEIVKKYISKSGLSSGVVLHVQKVVNDSGQFVVFIVYAVPLSPAGSVTITQTPDRSLRVRATPKWTDAVKANPVQAVAALVGLVLIIGRSNFASLLDLIHKLLLP